MSAALAPNNAEFIFVSAPFASCHASTIVELRNGDLLAAWFGGSGEGRRDVAIWGARRADGVWSVPVELVREARTPTWNPVLFHSSDGRLWLYYKFGTNPVTWRAARIWSDDGARSWSKSEQPPRGFYGPVRTKPLTLESGSIVSGSSSEHPLAWSAHIERSADDGRTWMRSGTIIVAPQSSMATDSPNDEPYGIIQPAVVSLGPNQLRFYARSSSHIGRICIADSFDAGETWTQAKPTNLPNPKSGVDAVSLVDGRIILCFNNNAQKRTPLNLAVSRDGENFNVFFTLEDQPGEYSYPAIIHGRDGTLHITYTWQRKRIAYRRYLVSEIPNLG